MIRPLANLVIADAGRPDRGDLTHSVPSRYHRDVETVFDAINRKSPFRAAAVASSGRAPRAHFAERHIMSLGTILLIVVFLLLIGALPRWSHSANWGYFPSGGLGIVLIVVLALFVMGRI